MFISISATRIYDYDLRDNTNLVRKSFISLIYAFRIFFFDIFFVSILYCTGLSVVCQCQAFMLNTFVGGRACITIGHCIWYDLVPFSFLWFLPLSEFSQSLITACLLICAFAVSILCANYEISNVNVLYEIQYPLPPNTYFSHVSGENISWNSVYLESTFDQLHCCHVNT